MCTGCWTQLLRSISHSPAGDVKRILGGFRPSEAHLNNGLASNLGQPFVQPNLVLLLEQDVADLVARLGQLLARQRLLGLELEQMVAPLGAERRRVLSWREPQDGLLDVGRQLSPLEDPEPAAVLAGGRIVGELSRQLLEILPAPASPA